MIIKILIITIWIINIIIAFKIDSIFKRIKEIQKRDLDFIYYISMARKIVENETKNTQK